MITVGSVVMGVDDVARATAFWTAALGYVPRDEPEPDWVVLRPASGGGPNLSLSRTTAEPQPAPHVHLDLYADDRAAEVERLVGLGATRVEWSSYPSDADFVVLADPAGNRFCVVDSAPPAQER